MNGRHRHVALLVVAGLASLLVAGLFAVVVWARDRARDVPLSPVSAGWFVGPTFPQRRGLTTDEPVEGELDDVSVLVGETFDPEQLDPAVRDFYERTADYEMRYRVRWHRPFRTGAALASHLTSRIEQLNLPGPGDEGWHRLESEFFAVEEPATATRPARKDVRAWVRTDPETGEAVFVALYATHHRDGEGFVNITVPVPGGGVDTVLRPENLDRGDDEKTGIRLSTEGGGDPGLYLRTPLGAFAVPGGQAFEVWRDGAQLRGTHEMWLLGRTFLTVEYEIGREEE